MKAERHRRISQEAIKVRPLPEGAFETALLYIKDAFPEETLGMSDTSFWIEIEKRAGAFDGSRKESIFQYYLRQYTHVSLALTLLNFFPPYRTRQAFGDITKEEKENLVSRLSAVLYEDFPPRYRKKHKKHVYS